MNTLNCRTSLGTRLYDGGFSNFGYDAVGNITTLPSSTYARRVSLIYGRNQKPTTYKLGSTQSLAYSLFDQTEMGYTNFNSGDVFMRYGSLELKNGVPFRYHHDHGYYDFVLEKWIYRISDYLGTPRVYFTDVNNDGNITLDDDALSYKTLYPFGMVASEYNRPSTSTERRDFTGHDLMIEGFQGLHDMNARQYVGGLGVFLSEDPLASSFPSYTPYHYVHNNPINLIDPTGMSADDIIINGDRSQKALEQLQASTDKLSFSRDGSTGKLTASVVDGAGKLNEAEALLFQAANDESVSVNITATSSNFDADGAPIVNGAFNGSTVDANGVTQASQTVNPDQMEKTEAFVGQQSGVTMMHETVEAYVGAICDPGSKPGGKGYDNAHSTANAADPRRAKVSYGLHTTKPIQVGGIRQRDIGIQSSDGRVMKLYTQKARQ